MIFNLRHVVFTILLLSLACVGEKTVDSGKMDLNQAPIGEDLKIVNVVPTGVRIPIEGKLIDPDSVLQPVRKPVQRPLPVVPFHQSSFSVDRPVIVTLQEPLKNMKPGEKEVMLPDTLAVQKTVIPAFQPKPVPAGVPVIRDDAQIDIRYLDASQGMNASYVLSILEDSLGYMWFGTLGGLSRYDGNTFIHYTTEEGLLHNWVNSLLEDRNGNIWFRTMVNGISRYDGSNFTHYLISDGLGRNAVSSLVEDDQGHIWIGTDNGLYRLVEDHFIHYSVKSGLSDNRINALYIDRDGSLWIGTLGGGVNRYDGQSFTHFNSRNGLAEENVNAIFQDREGKMWFGGEMLSAFDGNSFKHYSIRDLFRVRGIIDDVLGNLLVISDNGLLKFDGQNFFQLTKKEGLADNRIWSIMKDRLGRIWLGTAGGGLNRFSPKGFSFFNEQTGLNHSRVRAIFEDSRGEMWFGTRGGGVSHFDGKKFTHYSVEEGLNGAWVLPIVEDRRHRLWFGTENGVSMFEPSAIGKGGYFTSYTVKEGLSHNYTYTMQEDAHGNLWIGNDGGVTRFDGDQFAQFGKTEGMIDDVVWSILEDHDGNLWFGTRLGLTRFEPDAGGNTGYFTHFTDKEGLSDNVIWSIMEDSQNRLWLGTDKGINLFDGEDFFHYTVEDGLSHNAVRSIVEDGQKRIWVSTDNGISLLVPVGVNQEGDGSGSEYQIYNFGSADGLKRTHFELNAVCLDSKNRIWWGFIDGATMLDLNTFELPAISPKYLQLSRIEIEQQAVDFRRLEDSDYTASLALEKAFVQSVDSIVPFQNYPLELELPYHLNHLTFYFTGIDWQAPHQLHYSYKLEGLDRNWSPPSPENKAEYRNLPPGNFTLKVKTIGIAQKWSEPYTYPFSINPPWWQSWWAYLIYTLLVLLTLSGFYLYQRRRWQLQTALEVEQEKAQRLKELDHFKTRFYTNITHEFRTPLTVIKGMAEQIKGNEKIRKMIGRNGERMLQMVNQLLDLSKLEQQSLPLHKVQDNVIPFLRYVVESCHSLAQSKKLSMAFFARTDQLIMDFDELRLQQILINLLSNAIKFTPEYGSVKVIASEEMERDASCLVLTIQDTGIGILPNQLPHIFDRFYQIDDSATRKEEGSGIGLALVQELVRLLDGWITVESEFNIGTTFKVYLPIYKIAPKIQETTRHIPHQIFKNHDPEPAEKSVSGTERANAKMPEVLLIEDNLDVVTYISTCLQGQYVLKAARDGKKGLEKAIQRIPDLIICDIMMPEMDGFEVCRRLRADHRTSHIPVVILTARAGQEDKVVGLAQGADAYLTKPFDKEELLVRLANLILVRERLQQKFAHPLTPDVINNSTEQREAAFLLELHRIIEENLGEESFNTNQLCREIAMSRAQLHRKLKALTGKSTARYIRTIRLRKAKQLLENTDLPIGEIAQRVGFKDFSHFSRSFSKEFDQKPSDTRS